MTKWVILVFTLLLSVVTIYSLNTVDRFYVEKDQLLEDNQFLYGGTHWEGGDSNAISFQGNRLTITNLPGASRKVSQKVNIHSTAFHRFEFDAAVKDVVPTGDEEWHGGSIVVIYYDHNGDRVGARMFENLQGSKPLQSYSETFLVRDELSSVDIAFRLYSSGGELTFANPVMSRLQEVPFYKNMKISLVVAWVVLAAIVAVVIFRAASIYQLAVVAALALCAVVGALLPEAIITGLNEKLVTMMPVSIIESSRSLLNRAFGEGVVLPGGVVSKIGHFLVFAGLGILAGCAWRKLGVLFAISSIAVFALVTEVLQMMVEGRTTRMTDLVVDGTGAITGFLIGVICVWLLSLIGKFKRAKLDRIQKI